MLKKRKLGYRGIKHLYTKESSVTLNWGVEWDEQMIARDFLQNFRDANKDAIPNIKIEENKQSEGIRIIGQNVFNLDNLYYLGSLKGDEDIGQYGEGFKAACVSLFKLCPEAEVTCSSGNKAVTITMDEVSELKPLIYDFYKISDTKKSELHLNNLSKELIKELKKGMNLFWHDKHKHIKKYFYKSPEIAIYDSKTKEGAIFYRGLKRATLPVSTLIVIKEKVPSIERVIRQDRDRNSFQDDIIHKVAKHLKTSFLKKDTKTFTGEFCTCGLCEDACEDKVSHLLLNNIYFITKFKEYIKEGKGHILLKELFTVLDRLPLDTFLGGVLNNIVFNGKEDLVYASDSKDFFNNVLANNKDLAIRARVIEASFEKEMRIKLPQYFQKIGVISPLKQAFREYNQKQEEREKKLTKYPNKKEATILCLFEDMVSRYSPYMAELIYDHDVSYKMFKKTKKDEDLQGMYNSENRTIYFKHNLLTNKFGRALATFIHEWGHFVGIDGSEEFTNLLTEILEKTIDFAPNFSIFQKLWADIKNGKVSPEKLESIFDKFDETSDEDILKIKW